MTEHTCHARGCKKAVPPRMFMCRTDWFRLPKSMRDAIWAAYRPGQERDKNPSDEYLDAAMAAVNWLAAKDADEVAT